MTTINERIWQRHAHPWSGWFEVVSYPLVYVPEQRQVNQC